MAAEEPRLRLARLRRLLLVGLRGPQVAVKTEVGMGSSAFGAV
jgi:hypothetical protein